jgi:hypothetical protein
MVVSNEISERVKTLVTQIDDSLKSYNKETIETAGAPLTDLRDDLREAIQDHLREPVQLLIKKLQKNEHLSPDDINLIEKWVVGDAEYYTKIENNLLDWIAECKRLCNIIGSSYTTKEIEENDTKLFELGAYLTDLKSTLDDVIRFDDALNRVDRFNDTIGRGIIDTATRKWLAEVMERQLASEEF